MKSKNFFSSMSNKIMLQIILLVVIICTLISYVSFSRTKEDIINHGVGLKINCKKGDSIKVGDTICYVYHDEELKEDWLKQLQEAFVITDEKVDISPLIEKILK